jgi:hypothetical protein
MQEKAFEGIHQAEDSWFYRSRALAIQCVLSRFKIHNETICEVGAGFGAMCPALKPFGHVTAFEPDAEARKKCMENCDAVLPMSTISEVVQTKRQNFSFLTLLDVIEHVEDDIGFARELGELIPVGGHMLVTVPAFMWLWSELDVFAMHYRRYNKAQIIDVLQKAGFEVEYASYWNMMLLFPAALVRVGTGKAGYSAFSMPGWIDKIFFEWVRLETRLMSRLSLPFGTSVFVYARKKETARS